MKKLLFLASIGAFFFAKSQFVINVEGPANFGAKEAYVYTLDGSKDILKSKVTRTGNSWKYKMPESYVGMMKMFFPESNSTINFISENKDININFQQNGKKIEGIKYLDEANSVMNSIQDVQQKKEYILPALYQIKEYYTQDSNFGSSLDKEIERLSNTKQDASKFPFINYYTTNYGKYVEKNASQKAASLQDIQDFLVKSNYYLETSSLMRPVLMNYLNLASANGVSNIPSAIDGLLKAVDVETPRGQTVLSEVIDVFDVYGMNDMKTKYLTQAKNLKCTINNRLSSTISSNSSTDIGAKFANYNFVSATNTSAKSLYDVKAAKKIIIFWSSTCSHCEKEIPEILAQYNTLKKMNVEVVGLSLDSDKQSYMSKINSLPWINDSELKGWYSSVAEAYNVHATPTYFVLDADNKIIAKPDHAKDVIEYFKLK